MSYKTILVHVDQSRRAPERIRIAAQFAIDNEAHLVGVATTGLSPFVFTDTGLAIPSILPQLDLLRGDAERALSTFETQVKALGVKSFEKRLVNDEAGAGLSLHARYCDLTVIGQIDMDESSPTVRSDFPEYVLMNCARPVLLIPAAGTFKHVGTRALVAWNGSSEATRALVSALPLLRRAQQVDVVVFGSEPESLLQVAHPGADIGLYLARHGIRAEVSQHPIDIDVGNALLSAAADASSDLIVMGAYGHSRFREILLGGATRTVLASMTVPIWMAH